MGTSYTAIIDELVKRLILLAVAHKRLFTKPSIIIAEKIEVVKNDV